MRDKITWRVHIHRLQLFFTARPKRLSCQSPLTGRKTPTYLLTGQYSVGTWGLCDQGGGAGFSRSELDSLLLQWFSTAGSLDTAFVTLSLTAVERASCKVHKLLCNGWLPITLISVLLVVAVSPPFTGRSARDELFIATLTALLPSPSPVHNKSVCGPRGR